jgi:hypothetical protein
MEQVELVSPVSLPIKGSDTSDTSPASPNVMKLVPPAPTTVAELFANPPSWLPTQIKKYHEDPGRHFEPLCAAVAAVVLEDGLRWEEVAEEVRRELS